MSRIEGLVPAILARSSTVWSTWQAHRGNRAQTGADTPLTTLGDADK